MSKEPRIDTTPPPATDWRQEIIGMVKSQFWVMALTATAIALGAAVIAFRWPPTFEANASILMQGPGSRQILSGSNSRSEDMSQEDLSSELELLRSPDLIKLTVLALHQYDPVTDAEGNDIPQPAAIVPDPDDPNQPRRLAMPADMRLLLRQLEASRPSTEEAVPAAPLDDIFPQEALLQQLEQPLPPEQEAEWEDIKEHLEVQLLPSTKVIRFTLTGQDGKRTEQILDTYIDQYLLYRAHLFNPADQERFFSERAQVYKQRIEALEDQLLEKSRLTAVVHPEKEIESNLDLKRELARQYDQLSDDQIQSEYVSDPALKSRMEQIQRRIREIDALNLQLQQEIVERQRIARETTLGEFSYNLFSQLQEEDRLHRAIAAANLSGDVTILSRANLTSELVFPRPKQVLAVGLVAALFAGLALGCLNEYLDDTFKRERDIVHHAGLPVILSIRKTRTRLK